ncbi:hypothetical protein CO674_35695 [Rhizobium hidalgonense]|uniref:Integrase n=2 Tax=Rhizobium hidalgonense TaxID=1538159 RepID=A0ABX4JG21_9HYPH|nr:hypothetical protein CO674_35695 [Rhizobium hidalgonense]PON02997.1 hypothetical protein ATY29_32075 [Rhizobium hidalgonense]
MIDFAVPITPYPNQRLLTDPEFEYDLITIKLILSECVQPRPRGWITSREALAIVYASLLTFVRARVAMGIDRNSKLAPEVKRKYVERLKNGGHYNLVQYSERTTTVMSAFADKSLSIPLNIRKEVDFDAVARLLGVNHIASVPPEEVKRLKEYFGAQGIAFRELSKPKVARTSTKKLSLSRATELLKPWLWLDKLRDVLSHDPIPFRAYVNRREIEREVKKWSKDKGSTKELHPNQVVHLLSKSLQFLTDPLTPFLIDLVAKLRPGFILPLADRTFIDSRLSSLGLNRLSSDYTQNTELSEAVSLRTLALVFIPIAVSCVYAMGTARRKDEIDSQHVGSVTTDKQGQLWLRTPIRKLKNRSVGKGAHTATIPISGTVKLAIDVMENLKKATGHASEYLFDILDPVLGGAVDLDLSRRLKSYGRWLQVQNSTDGTETELAAHQFRKFFAITYFYRYRFPSLPALSLHMMHLNLDVTRAYLATAARNSLQLLDEANATAKESRGRSEDATRMEDFEEIGRAFVFDILLSASKGETKLAGVAGLHLMRDLAKITEQLGNVVDVHDAVAADDALNSLIRQLAEGKAFRPHPEGNGFCTCDRTLNCLMAANCLKAKAKALEVDIKTFSDVDHAFAEDLTCGNCIHHFLLPELWPYWEEEITRCESALKRARGEQRTVLEERLAGLRGYEEKVTWKWAAQFG